jgi:hypothetical protein
MPVRKIPKNYLKVTGAFSSAKNDKSLGHEELLERDLMILLEFDDTVEHFEEQPVKVPVVVNGKKQKPYVPDILIHYLPTSSGEARRPVLGEVKHSTDLKKNKAKYAAKFEAAKRYAEVQGWEWHIFTEKEIRIPLLDNLKFLRDYHYQAPDASLLQEINLYLQNARGSVTPESLLQNLSPTEDRILYMAPALWHLVATKRIAVNLRKPLTMKSKLSLPGNE